MPTELLSLAAASSKTARSTRVIAPLQQWIGELVDEAATYAAAPALSSIAPAKASSTSAAAAAPCCGAA